jgi:hypothetical protein
MDTKHLIKIYKSFEKSEFEEYFSNIGMAEVNGFYNGDGWRVKIGDEEEVFVGAFRMRQIKIELWLREDIEKQFIEDMRIEFLRGGG